MKLIVNRKRAIVGDASDGYNEDHSDTDSTECTTPYTCITARVNNMRIRTEAQCNMQLERNKTRAAWRDVESERKTSQTGKRIINKFLW